MIRGTLTIHTANMRVREANNVFGPTLRGMNESKPKYHIYSYTIRETQQKKTKNKTSYLAHYIPRTLKDVPDILI